MCFYKCGLHFHCSEFKLTAIFFSSIWFSVKTVQQLFNLDIVIFTSAFSFGLFLNSFYFSPHYINDFLQICKHVYKSCFEALCTNALLSMMSVSVSLSLFSSWLWIPFLCSLASLIIFDWVLRQLWFSHCWVFGFCCLVLENVPVCSKRQASHLQIILVFLELAFKLS